MNAIKVCRGRKNFACSGHVKREQTMFDFTLPKRWKAMRHWRADVSSRFAAAGWWYANRESFSLSACLPSSALSTSVRQSRGTVRTNLCSPNATWPQHDHVWGRHCVHKSLIPGPQHSRMQSASTIDQKGCRKLVFGPPSARVSFE